MDSGYGLIEFRLGNIHERLIDICRNVCSLPDKHVHVDGFFDEVLATRRDVVGRCPSVGIHVEDFAVVGVSGKDADLAQKNPVVTSWFVRVPPISARVDPGGCFSLSMAKSLTGVINALISSRDCPLSVPLPMLIRV